MTSIFISYRVADTAPYARLLNDTLAHNVGQEAVFYDKKRLEDGDIWPEELERSIRESKIVLVLISDANKWLGGEESGKRRIDWVRKEVETAFNQDKIVIPVLINGGEVPPADDLPESLRKITTIQARKLKDESWDDSLPQFIQIIGEKLGVNTFVNQNNFNQKFSWVSFFKTHALRMARKGQIITVNCDRHDTYGKGVINHFKEHYNRSGNMVFFVPACTSQKPVSLAKRLSFDLTMFNEDICLTYPRVSADKDSELDIIDFEASLFDFELTFSSTWKKCISSFQSDASDPVIFATDGVYREMDLILLVFRVSEIQWSEVDNLCEHIEFFISKFANQGSYSTKFILFFTLEIRTVHLSCEAPNNNFKINELRSLADKIKAIPGINSYISPILRPVEEDEIKNWVSHIAPDIKQNTLTELIDIFRSNTLNNKEQPNLFNMEDVEEMQHAAYQYSLTQSA